MSKDYKCTISVRMGVSMLTKLDTDVRNKLYKDRTEAIIKRIESSYTLDELMKIASNPKLQKEMNEKIKSMLSNSSIEQTLETMTVKQRNAIVFYATHLNEKAITQTNLGS